MTVREQLHQLVDELPEPELPTVRQFLLDLRATAVEPMLRALRDAPEDDEPTTGAEDAGADEAWAEYLRGDVVTADEAKRQLLE